MLAIYHQQLVLQLPDHDLFPQMHVEVPGITCTNQQQQVLLHTINETHSQKNKSSLSYYCCPDTNFKGIPPQFHCSLGYPEVLVAHLVLVIPLKLKTGKNSQLAGSSSVSERQNRPDHNYIVHSYLQEVLVFLEILEALAVPRKKKKKEYVLNSMM